MWNKITFDESFLHQTKEVEKKTHYFLHIINEYIICTIFTNVLRMQILYNYGLKTSVCLK